ncbi:MAG: hypothetical protein ABIO29_03395 [Sphingomicrobium sp.]
MSGTDLSLTRRQIDEQIAEVRSNMPRLSPIDLHVRMDAIRALACECGVPALESLARTTSQLALLPGHRVAMTCALEHVEEAFACRSEQDTTAMLAALALRLH